MKMPLTATMQANCTDALSMYVSTDRNLVELTIGRQSDDKTALNRLRIDVATKGRVNVFMLIEDARTLAAVLLKNADYAELHGLEEDQHPDAIAARNYMANAKRMREARR